MKKTLKKEELPKVIRTNPGKYIFATSVDLSVTNAEEIKEIFNPYIKNLSDIYGLKDLNKLLDLHPEVLRTHYKLWYSSTDVLQKILHYEIEGRTNEFQETELKRKIRLYVPTISLANAQEVLHKNKFVIITGAPGVGKTTTAELLLYSLIKDDYELVYIYDDLRDIESKISLDDKKQVFYYDDFLGHNAVEMVKARESETALMKLIRRITSTKNKRFILTTRTFILKTAIEESEKLRHLNLIAKASTVELSEYTLDIKLKLLKNHIGESKLNTELISILNEKEIQNFIISHPNFSPRSVEFITLNELINGLSSDEYEIFIRNNFNSPDEIWRHAYEQQINDMDRMMLNTMFSFGYSVTLEDLEIAFNNRLNYEVKHNNFQKPLNVFKNSFRKLEGGFIIQLTNFPNWFQFINPSLTDFLIKNLKTNLDELMRIAESSTFLRQLTARLLPLGRHIDKDLPQKVPERLKQHILNEYKRYIRTEFIDLDTVEIIVLLHTYTSIEKAKAIILDLLDSVRNWDVFEIDHDLQFYFEYFIESVKDASIIDKIKQLAPAIAPTLLFRINDLDEFIDFSKLLMNKFDIDFSTVYTSKNLTAFNKKITDMIDDKIEEEIFHMIESSTAESDAYRFEQEIQNLKEYFKHIGLKVNPNFSKFYDINWQEVALENYFIEQMRKDD
jgi:energy-coupling factor transporter ATP-binding protein EcfA2